MQFVKLSNYVKENIIQSENIILSTKKWKIIHLENRVIGSKLHPWQCM